MVSLLLFGVCYQRGSDVMWYGAYGRCDVSTIYLSILYLSMACGHVRTCLCGVMVGELDLFKFVRLYL